MGKSLVFDLETKHLAHEVGGWGHIDKLGLAAAVLLDVDHDEAKHFTEEHAGELIDEIIEADRIIGFNIIRFDYVVLRPYGLAVNEDLVERTTDLMLDIYQALGFRVALDNLVSATLQESKIADGLQAVAWYKEGLIDKVLEYCEHDVRVTQRLWDFGVQNKHVRFRDDRHRIQTVPVSWS